MGREELANATAPQLYLLFFSPCLDKFIISDQKHKKKAPRGYKRMQGGDMGKAPTSMILWTWIIIGHKAAHFVWL